MASGSGCKSPAGRRRGGDDWSAGRSAASRDGRRALIARSQDLPRAPLPRAASDATRGTDGSIRPGLPSHPADGPANGRMRRIPYCRETPPGPIPRSTPFRGRTSTGSRGHFWERRRSPAVPPDFPAPNSVPHACSERPRAGERRPATPARESAPKERSPPACVGRRSMDGDARAMSPVWTRSGSRPNKSWLLGS